MNLDEGRPELPSPHDGELALDSIDLFLEEGTAEELAGLRYRIAEDPLAAIDYAETVDLCARLRTVRTEPSARFAARLSAITRRAERWAPSSPPSMFGRLLVAAAAAIIGFGAGYWFDAAQRSAGAVEDVAVAQVGLPLPPRAAASGVVQPAKVTTSAELERERLIEIMRRRFELESADELSAALAEAEQAPRNPLDSWLDPSNRLALRELDHELRVSQEIRLAALRSEGAMLAADQRVQALADGLAEELTRSRLDDGRYGVHDVAFAARALIAAGVTDGARRRALLGASGWLADRLPQMVAEDQAVALAALVESVVVDERPMSAIATAGKSLVDSVLDPTGEAWLRRRPRLLDDATDNHTLGDAGHTLALLPGFGVDAARCGFVRRLLLGELRQRRGRGVGDPDVLAAMLYGFGDLLTARERDGLALQLRRWKPAHLAPDFVTVQQIAWGITPGSSGFTRMQLGLRQLVVLPEPAAMELRGALCLSLASSFAASRAESLERFSAGD